MGQGREVGIIVGEEWGETSREEGREREEKEEEREDERYEGRGGGGKIFGKLKVEKLRKNGKTEENFTHSKISCE